MEQKEQKISKEQEHATGLERAFNTVAQASGEFRGSRGDHDAITASLMLLKPVVEAEIHKLVALSNAAAEAAKTEAKEDKSEASAITGKKGRKGLKAVDAPEAQQ